MAESTQSLESYVAVQRQGNRASVFWRSLAALGAMMALANVAWSEVSVGEIKARGKVFTAEDFIEEEKPVEEMMEKEKGDRLRFLGAFKKKPAYEGYLIDAAPVAIRFSDADEENKRVPMPALPEYSILSNRYIPYLIEEPLPEDERVKKGLLSAIIVDMAEHEVVSGAIDFSSGGDDYHTEELILEEDKSTILRPEEVLIFFEGDILGSGSGSSPDILVPFNPATAGPQTIQSRSSAKYTIEE
ncbi:MAG: hypothetical protein AAGB46_19840 [Verrucomicrobiota bacterium]